MISQDQILTALTAVHDPELHKSIVELNMIRHVSITENH
ncbi:MAG: iron-sulfur cluster assembly protein, partial [Firmicutes bacterium]|nr:iron-sulfur cluster assembly protein [Bacillota bacterium]